MIRNLILFVCLLMLTGSCGVQKKSMQDGDMATQQADSAAESRPYRPTADKYWELIHTDIELAFNFRERTVDGTARLVMHPYFYATDRVVLDAKSMLIKSVTDRSGSALPFEHRHDSLIVRLPLLLQRKDTLQLSIRYLATPYQSEGVTSAAITGARGMYFINPDGAEPYQPFQVWTQGEPESNSRWFPTFDKPNYRSTFQLVLQVPDSLKTLSNGTLYSSRPDGKGFRRDIWKQEQPVPPYLVMLAIGDFHVEKEFWNGKEVSYWVPQEYAAYAKGIFAHTPEMLQFFSDLLNVEYPWDKYSQVAVYDFTSGAMENVTASVFGSFTLKDQRGLADQPNDGIVAHELFHHWFGNYVTAESWSQLTLNESFADYGEKLWKAHKYGETEAEMARLSSLNQYLNQAKTQDPPLLRHHYHQIGEMFDRVSYSKGGLILHYLRMLSGDKAFFEALELFLKSYALSGGEVAQLRLCFEQVTGKDWRWFFEQWYGSGGHPILRFSYHHDAGKKQLHIRVRQEQSGRQYRLPLKLQLLEGNSLITLDWTMDAAADTLIYTYSDAIPVVIPDAGNWLPGVIHEDKSFEDWRRIFLFDGAPSETAPLELEGLPVVNAISVRNRVLALDSAFQKAGKQDAESLLISAFASGEGYVRRKAMELLAVHTSKITLNTAWQDRLLEIARKDPDNYLRSQAYLFLAGLSEKRFESTYELDTDDRSYWVAAAALKALHSVNPAKAREKIRLLETQNHRSAYWLREAGLALADREAHPDDARFFKEHFLRLFEADRSSFAEAYILYLSKIKEESIYREGFRILREAGERAVGRHRFPLNSRLYQLHLALKKQAENEKAPEGSDRFKQRSREALAAWQAYKSSISDQRTLKAIAELEK